MRTWNFLKCRRTAVFFRLCLGIIVALTLSLGGMALNTQPAQAIFDISPAAMTIDAFECVSFVDTQLQVTCCTCSIPPNNLFFWLVDTGWGIPGWVNIDQNTGAISGCPPFPSAGTYKFGVRVSELCVCPNLPHTTCTPGDCWPNGAATLPCVTISPTTTNVTINVAANIPPCVTLINPTFYPVAWEGAPFTMTLTATGGGAGPLNWTATGLPTGLTVTDAALGIISGTPGPGTCGLYTVTATVTDTSLCTDPTCCPPISRPFIFIVDCWANYLPIFYYTTACDFNVEIGPGLTLGQTNVLVDGAHEATLAGGQSQTFTSVPCESHTVMVDQTVQPGSNIRFSVIGSNIKPVTDVDNHAYFNYAQEVYIQTASDPSGKAQPPGVGYYAVGSNFSSTAPSTIESDIGNGIKYVFWEWQLPDGTTRPNVNLVFTVNQGGTAVAKYKTYYQLILHSEYPAINESSFEPAGSTATWNLSLHAVPLLGLWGFLGGVQSPLNASGSQLMTGPSTVEIQWAPNYTMPIIAIVILLLVIAGLIYLIYRLRSRSTRQATGTGVKEASSKAKKTAAENFCPKCGNPVDKNADYCKKCGKKLT